MNLAERSSRRAPQKAIGSSAYRRICAAPTWAKCLRPFWLRVGLTNSMLKHLPQQLMLKSEKYFMKLVSHRFLTDARHSKHTMTCVQRSRRGSCPPTERRVPAVIPCEKRKYLRSGLGVRFRLE